MNDTLRILSSLARKAQKMREDPRLAQLEDEADRLQRDFLKKHHKNDPLLKQMDDLLLSQCLLAEHRAEFQFLLGLQMGLELRDLDLLRDVLDREIRFFPSP